MNPLETGTLLLREMMVRPRWAWYHLWGHLDERYLLAFHRRRLADSGRYLKSFEEVLARVSGSKLCGELGEVQKGYPGLKGEPDAASSTISRRSDGSSELLRMVWWVTRLIRPETVVEVGVGRGATTQTILTAMRQNDMGRLYSVEFPALRRGYAEEVGVLVAPELRDRWTLLVGPSQVRIPALRTALGHVDLFVHDGAHSYHVQRRDYEEAFRALRPGGVLISDDVNNDSFLEVVERYGSDPLLVRQGKDFPIGVAFKPNGPP